MAGHAAAAWELFLHELLRVCYASLSPERQLAIEALAGVGVGMAEGDAEGLMLAGLMAHPVTVREALCGLYDLGLMHFTDCCQLHEVDTRVRAALPAVTAAQQQQQQQQPATGAAKRKKKRAPHVLPMLHICGEVLRTTWVLFQQGNVLSSLRCYTHRRHLVDHALRLVGQWLAGATTTGPTPPCEAAPAAEKWVMLMCGHLNKVCRHVLVPEQQAHLGSLLAAVAPLLPSPRQRAAALITAGRALVAGGFGAAVLDAQALLAEAQGLMRVGSSASNSPVQSGEAEGGAGQVSGAQALVEQDPEVGG